MVTSEQKKKTETLLNVLDEALGVAERIVGPVPSATEEMSGEILSRMEQLDAALNIAIQRAEQVKEQVVKINNELCQIV